MSVKGQSCDRIAFPKDVRHDERRRLPRPGHTRLRRGRGLLLASRVDRACGRAFRHGWRVVLRRRKPEIGGAGRPQQPQVITIFGLIGLLDGFLPAWTDRQGFWTIGGEAIRWLGVVLFAEGGALRLWPVAVLG